MTRFEYLAIFYGIVIGLALENVASSFHKLLEARGRVRWHWMAPTNAIGAGISTLGVFWLWWLGRDLPHPDPTFLTFLPGAVTALLTYLICAATLPDAVPEAGIDLKEFYFSGRRQFWSLIVITLLLREGTEVWALARGNFDPQVVRFSTPLLIGTVVAIAIAASMIFIKAPRWHAVGIVAMTAGVFVQFGSMKL